MSGPRRVEVLLFALSSVPAALAAVLLLRLSRACSAGLEAAVLGVCAIALGRAVRMAAARDATTTPQAAQAQERNTIAL